MTLSIVGSSSLATFASTISLTVPNNAVTGDKVLVLCQGPRYVNWVAPSNMSLAYEDNTGTNNLDARMAIYMGTVGTSGLNPGSTVTVGDAAGSSQNRSAIMVTVHSSINANILFTPLSDSILTGVNKLANPGNTTPTAPTISMPASGLLFYAFSHVLTGTPPPSAVQPSGYTLVQHPIRTAANGMLAYKTVSSGSTGTAASTTGGAAAWIAHHIGVYESTPDTAAPVITMDQVHGTGPVDDIYSADSYNPSNNLLGITGTVSDNVGVTRVECTRYGDAWKPALVIGGQWAINLDVTSWGPGSHLILARALDAADNVSPLVSRTVWHSPDGLYGAAAVPGDHLVPLRAQGADTPSTENIMVVPSYITYDGTEDVAADLTAWFANEVAPISEPVTVQFQPGGVYRIMDGPVHLGALSDVIIEGQEATLLRDDLIDESMRHPNVTGYLMANGASNVTIRNLHTSGVNTNDPAAWPTWKGAHELVPGSGQWYLRDADGDSQGPITGPSFFTSDPGGAGIYNYALAFEVAFHISDSSGIVIEYCNLHGAGSDGVYFNNECNDCTVRGVEVRRNGRQGIAPVHGTNILIEYCDIVSTRSCIDLEPLGADEFIDGMTIRYNTLKAQLNCLAAGPTRNIDNVHYYGNTWVLGGPCTASGGPNRAGTRNGWVVENNTGLQKRSNAAFVIQNTDSFVIRNNTVEGDSTPGYAVRVEGTAPSTGIVIDDNDLPGYTTAVGDIIGGSSWTASGNTPESINTTP